MPGTGSYKRTTQNQGGGPAKYGTAISLIGIPRLLARVISRRAYENTSANNELICSTITLFNGIINNLNEVDTKLKNKILFTKNIDIPPINTTLNITDLNVGGTDGIAMRLNFECLIRYGFNVNFIEIQTIRIIQGNNDYSVTGTIISEQLERTEYILITFGKITVITDNNGGTGGNGIYNINDPITIQFSLPPP